MYIHTVHIKSENVNIDDYYTLFTRPANGLRDKLHPLGAGDAEGIYRDKGRSREAVSASLSG